MKLHALLPFALLALPLWGQLFFTTNQHQNAFQLASNLEGSNSTRYLSGCSGLVVSLRNSNFFWAIDDQAANRNRVFLICQSNGSRVARYHYTNFPQNNVQIEDIAIGRDADGISYLYLAGIGNNGEAAGQGKIIRVPEPDPDEGSGDNLQLSGGNLFYFDLPPVPWDTNSGVDAETLMFDHQSKDLLFVPKSVKGDKKVYRMKHEDYKNAHQTTVPIEGSVGMTRIALYFSNGITNVPGGGAFPNERTDTFMNFCGGDISLQGRRMVVLDYWDYFLWQIHPDETAFDALQRRPDGWVYNWRQHSGNENNQREAVAFAHNGNRFFSTIEQSSSRPSIKFFNFLSNDLVAPVVGVSSTPTHSPNPIEVTLVTSEVYGYWSTNQGLTWNRFSESNRITIDHSCSLHFFGVDVFSNTSITNQISYTIGGFPPSVTLTPNSLTTNTAFVAAISIPYGEGVFSTNFGATWTPFPASGTNLNVFSNTTLWAFGSNGMGGGPTNQVTWAFDTQAPTLQGLLPNLETNGVLALFLSVSEGQAFVFLNGAGPITFSNLGLTLSLSNDTALACWARDGAGNVTSNMTRNYAIRLTPQPVLTRAQVSKDPRQHRVTFGGNWSGMGGAGLRAHLERRQPGGGWVEIPDLQWGASGSIFSNGDFVFHWSPTAWSPEEILALRVVLHLGVRTFSTHELPLFNLDGFFPTGEWLTKPIALGNPMRPGTGHLRIVGLSPQKYSEVWAPSGRKVRTLPLPDIFGSVIWDGRSEGGQVVPPGTYLVAVPGWATPIPVLVLSP